MDATKNPHKGGRQSDYGRHFTTQPPAPSGFDQIDAALLPRADMLLNEWLPDGKLSGHEYTALNPTRADTRPGSFKINTATGIWEDFATGDNGPGLMSLFAYINRMDKPDAAAELAQRYGLQAASASDKPPPKTKPRDEWQPVTPVPETAPPPLAYTPKPGETVTRYDYRGIDGRLLHLVYRVDRAGPEGKKEKDFFPVTWCKHKVTGAYDWRWKAIPDKRSLFGLETLAEKLGAPVMVVEGEQAALAARQLLPDWVVVTSSGGSKAPSKSDWSALVGHRVVIWPDADLEGSAYASTVARLLRQLGVVSVKVLNLAAFGDLLQSAKGWDAHDALAAGVTTADILAAVPADEVKFEKIVIDLEPGELKKAWQRAERALIAAGLPIYERYGTLVRPVIYQLDVKVDGSTLPAGTLAIENISSAYLAETFEEVAIWRKWNERKGGYSPMDCPEKVATRYLANAGNWAISALNGVIECPTLRPDGTLLTRPGYDPLSGLYLDYTGKAVHVPDHPTREEALAALVILKEPFEEFPFVSESDRAAILSAVLTVLSRRAYPTAPYFAADAPKKGSGKGLQVNVCAIIATGRTATAATFGATEEETEKRLGALLMRGAAVINMDNASRAIDGQFLCMLATEEVVHPRILGKSETVAVKSNTVTLFFTGNNMEVRGDLTRRVIGSRIDAKLERPDARAFKRSNLKKFVADNRHRYIQAGLTILRAFIVAGKPAPVGAEGKPIEVAPYGSYVEWDELVRRSLLWLGEPDPLVTRERIEATDTESARLGTLLAPWFSLYRSAEKTAGELIAAATREKRNEIEEELHQAMMAVAPSKDGSGIDHRRLGSYLSKHADNIADGYRLEKAGSIRRAVVWKVLQLKTDPQAAPASAKYSQGTKNNSHNSHNSHNSPVASGEFCELGELNSRPPPSFAETEGPSPDTFEAEF